MSQVVGQPEDRLSRVAAHILKTDISDSMTSVIKNENIANAAFGCFHL